MCTILLAVGWGTETRGVGKKESWLRQLMCARGGREGCFILNDQENTTDSMTNQALKESAE